MFNFWTIKIARFQWHWSWNKVLLCMYNLSSTKFTLMSILSTSSPNSTSPSYVNFRDTFAFIAEKKPGLRYYSLKLNQNCWLKPAFSSQSRSSLTKSFVSETNEFGEKLRKIFGKKFRATCEECIRWMCVRYTAENDWWPMREVQLLCRADLPGGGQFKAQDRPSFFYIRQKPPRRRIE